MSPQTVIFYGPSGAGKGTQARMLRKYIEEHDPERTVLYLETGASLRKFVEESESYTSTLVGETLGDGKLLPSFVPIWVLTDFLIRHYTGEEHMIWDGLARRRTEATILDSALSFYSRENCHVIVLNVSRDWSVTRLKERGREDDIEESDIDNRLSWYESEVVPAIDFFREQGTYNVHDINGEQAIEEVHTEILNALNLTSNA